MSGHETSETLACAFFNLDVNHSLMQAGHVRMTSIYPEIYLRLKIVHQISDPIMYWVFIIVDSHLKFIIPKYIFISS